jgi:hypothetical protein
MVLPSVVLVQVCIMFVLALLWVFCPSLHVDPSNIFFMRYFLLSWVGNGSHRWRHLSCSWFRWVESFLGVFLSLFQFFWWLSSDFSFLYSFQVPTLRGISWALSCQRMVSLEVFLALFWYFLYLVWLCFLGEGVFPAFLTDGYHHRGPTLSLGGGEVSSGLYLGEFISFLAIL